MFTHTSPTTLLVEGGADSSPTAQMSLPLLLHNSTEADASPTMPGWNDSFSTLPKDVMELVLDTVCDGGLPELWGNLKPRHQVLASPDYCMGDVNCTATAPQAPKGALVIFPILLFITGIVGQIWALVYLYRTPRPNSRTVFYVMLSTLLWTDLAGKVLTTPPAVIAYVNEHWAGGRNLCHYHGYVMSLIGMVTHLLVCAMAIERLLGIRHGYFYNQNVTTYRVKSLLTGVWGVSMVVCSLPLFGVGRFVLQFPGSWCFIDTHLCSDAPALHAAFTYAYGTINIIALIVMVICNVVVVGTLLKMRVTRAVPSFQKNERLNSIRSHGHSELEIQMVIVLLVITSVFVISWGPFDIILFTNNIWPHIRLEDHWTDLVAIRLVSVNQIVNPWSYIICRVAIRSRMCRCCRRALAGRRFSLLDDGGKRPSIVNSLRSLRKWSRKGDESSPMNKECPSDNSIGSYGRSHKVKRPSTASLMTEKTVTTPLSYKHLSMDSERPLFPRNDTNLASLQVDESMIRDINNVVSEDLKKLAFIEAKTKRSHEERVKSGDDAGQFSINMNDFYRDEAVNTIPAIKTRDDIEAPRIQSPTRVNVNSKNVEKERRSGVPNLFSQHLGKVTTNRSIFNMKNASGWLEQHKRTQSLDGSGGELLLVVPVAGRCASHQTLVTQGKPVTASPENIVVCSADQTLHIGECSPRPVGDNKMILDYCPEEECGTTECDPQETQLLIDVSCKDNILVSTPGSNIVVLEHPESNNQVSLDDKSSNDNLTNRIEGEDRSPVPPDSAGVTTDEDYFSSYNSVSGMFQPIDSDHLTTTGLSAIKTRDLDFHMQENNTKKHFTPINEG